MIRANQELVSPFDFDNAKFLSVPIYVIQNDTVVDYGKIITHSEELVYLTVGCFEKGLYVFRVSAYY